MNKREENTLPLRGRVLCKRALENGRIIERGNHEKLIAEKGKYYQLYTGAFELE